MSRHQLGIEPINPAPTTPTATKPPVTILRRVAVSHSGVRAISQARNPVAPAPATIAPAMHCMHMRESYPQRLFMLRWWRCAMVVPSFDCCSVNIL